MEKFTPHSADLELGAPINIEKAQQQIMSGYEKT